MRFRPLAFTLVVALVSALASMSPTPCTANRIPGIPLIIRCPCPGLPYVESTRCCTKKSTSRVAGGIVPGSAAFDEPVLLQGQCAYACSPGDPGDGRIDYDADADVGPFTMTLPAMTLHSNGPIQVDVNGVLTPFDVIVTMSGLSPAPDDPMTGLFALPPGSSLPLGATGQVASSGLDVHATTTFVNALTGEQAPAVIEEDFHLTLFTFTPDPLPVTRVADGTAVGSIVLGLGAPPVVFGYSSPDNNLVLNLQSLFDAAPTPTRNATWGSLKTLYR